MTVVRHADQRSVVGGGRSNLSKRIDPCLISLPLEQVYFVPERRLVARSRVKAALDRYKGESQRLRS